MKFLFVVLTMFSVLSCTKTVELFKGNLNATWQVSLLHGKDVSVRNATCIIKTADKKADGNGGCNTYETVLTLDESKQNITFKGAITTFRSCFAESLSFESDYLEQLSKVTAYEFKDENTLLLKDSANNTLITLVK